MLCHGMSCYIMYAHYTYIYIYTHTHMRVCVYIYIYVYTYACTSTILQHCYGILRCIMIMIRHHE